MMYRLKHAFMDAAVKGKTNEIIKQLFSQLNSDNFNEFKYRTDLKMYVNPPLENDEFMKLLRDCIVVDVLAVSHKRHESGIEWMTFSVYVNERPDQRVVYLNFEVSAFLLLMMTHSYSLPIL